MGKGQWETLRRFPGVQVYISDKRKTPDGKPDKCFYIRYKDLNGKLIREKVGWASEGITAAYAHQLRAERIRSIRLGEEIVPLQQKRKEALSFAEFMEQKYLPHSKENKAPDSYRREEELYRLYLKPIIGDKVLKDVSSFDLERVKKKMRDLGRSERTIEYCLAVARRVFNVAKIWGFFSGENPVSSVKFPRFDNRRDRTLTREEAEALLGELKRRSLLMYRVALVSLYCGLRFSEIANLRWADVSLEKGLLFVRDTKSRENRVVPLPEIVRKMFSEMEPGEPEAFVFVGRKGPLTRHSLHTFRRAVEAVGLNQGIKDRRKKITFHSLRHSFASWLAEMGVDFYKIGKLLGHRTPTLAERYSHLSGEALRNAIKSLDRLTEEKPEVIEFDQNNKRSQIGGMHEGPSQI